MEAIEAEMKRRIESWNEKYADDKVRFGHVSLGDNGWRDVSLRVPSCLSLATINEMAKHFGAVPLTPWIEHECSIDGSTCRTFLSFEYGGD